MPRKEFVKLMEENVLKLNRLGERLKVDPGVISEYSRQQLTTLVRLEIGGRARLKDIARREVMTTPNLCAMFRRLEKDGLVKRTIDEDDRRNTWYSVTPAGSVLAKKALDKFRESIEVMFKDIGRADEEKLSNALKSMNEVLTKMEQGNA